MVHAILGARGLLAMLIALATGTWGLHAYPVQTDNVVPGADCAQEAVRVSRPGVRVRDAVVHDAVPRRVAGDIGPRDRRISLSADGAAAPVAAVSRHLSARPTPTLVLGETHFARTLGRAPAPDVARRFRSAGSTRA